MSRNMLLFLILTAFLTITGDIWSDVTVYIEPDTLQTHSKGNTLFVYMDNPLEEVPSLPFDVMFDTDCFTVTAVNKTVRSDSMDIFLYNYIGGGIRFAMTGIGHSIYPGSGPVAEICVDVGRCVEGDYIWHITNCFYWHPLWDLNCTGLDTEIRVIFRNDVNGDGSIDIQDVIAIVNHMLRYDLLSEEEFKRADFNNDSVINVLDVVRIINEILGLEDLFKDYAHGFWRAVAGDTLGDYGQGLLDCNWYAIDTKSSPDSVLVTWEEGLTCPTKSGIMNSKGEFFIYDGKFPEEGSTTAEFIVLSEERAFVTFYVLWHNSVHVFEKTLMKTREDPTIHCF